MINYIEGDLFQSRDQVLVHGCNCMQRMGSGVAKRVKELYPAAFQADLENSSYGDRGKLGTFTHASVRHALYNSPLIVVNAYIQYNFGTNQMQIDYEALKSAMFKVNTLFSDKTISMPKIGAGRAGGDWKTIEQILNQVFQHKPINVYHLKGE